MNVISGAMGGLAAVTSGMSALASNFSAIGTEASNAFGALDGMLVASTALIAGFTVEAAKAYGEFEQGMKVVQAVSGQTGAAISELSSKATQMSVAYRTSINDITDGLQTLGRAGLNSASEQIDVLESGLQTAKLEGRSLNGVLEELIQNTAMLGGDLKSVNFGEQSEYINSLLVGTSMTAPIDSHDISQTLQYAGGTAAAAGANIASEEGKKKLEDLMGTVAAFAQKGVTGSMAGTALRAFFTKPASQDASVTNALSELGLAPEDLWEDGGESMKSVSDQIGLIHRRMESLNMSTMDQVELWGKIVGAKMGQQMMKLDSSSIKELTRDIQSAKSAEDLATQTLQTYNQKLSEMEQQGQVAYREFGEKAAFWLRYPIEGATKLLEFLSNPVINTVAFAGVGSLLAHGFRTAYGMAQTLYRQIRELINGVVAGIEQINGAAGASSTGFSQSATQVDFLNAKLHETDATLQSIQAKSMGIRPGYQIPGGLYTDRVPKRTFNAYEEDVIVDEKGITGYGPGAIFSGDKKKWFEDQVDKYAENKKNSFESQTEDRKNDISAKKQQIKDLDSEEQRIINKRVKAKEDALTEEHNSRIKAIEEEEKKALQGTKRQINLWKKIGLPSDVQDRALADPAVKNAESIYGMKSPELQKAIAPYVAESNYKNIDPNKYQNEIEEANIQYQMALEEVERRTTEEVKGIYDDKREKLQGDLRSLEAASIKDETLSDQQIKETKKEAIQKRRTELKLYDEHEFEAWKRRQEGRGQIGSYSLDRTKQFYDETSTVYQQYSKEIKALSKRGFYIAAESIDLPDPHPNAQMLGQSLNKGVPDAMIEARQRIIDQQKEQLLGHTGVGSKLYNVGADRLNVFSRAVGRGTSAVGGFTGKIQKMVKDTSISARSLRRGRGFWTEEGNLPILQDSAIEKIRSAEFQKLNKGADVATVATNLRRELNLTATEFTALINTEEQYREVFGLTGKSLEKVSVAAERLQNAIAKTTISEEEERMANEASTQAELENIEAKKANSLQTLQEAASEEIGVFGNFSAGISKAGSGLKSAATKAIGFLGGPLMTGMMGITVAMQIIQASQQKWQEQMQKATEELSEATDSISQSEEDIKQLYSSENKDITDADLDKALDQQYASIYDSFYNGVRDRTLLGRREFEKDVSMEGKTDKDTDEYKKLTAQEIESRNTEAEAITLSKEENIKALQENTMELAEATAAYNQAQAREAEVFNDSTWGFDSFTADISDAFGKVQEDLGAALGFKKSGFLDNGVPILTASQMDSNYAGGTDFADIFAADVYRFKNERGLFLDDWGEDANNFQKYSAAFSQFFGSDFERIMSLIGSTSQSALYENAFNMGEMNADEMSLAQMSLKNDKEDYQKLGKQMYRYEQSTDFKRAAYTDEPTIRKALSGDKKALASLGKINTQGKNLTNTVSKLLARTNNHLSEQNILAMGQLQQLQDMYSIANETIAPGVMNTVSAVYDNVSHVSLMSGNSDSTRDGAVLAGHNAAVIAATLGAQAQETAEKRAYRQYNKKGGDMTEEQFLAMLGDDSNQSAGAVYYRNKVFEAIRGAGWSVNNPGASPDDIYKNSKRLIQDSNYYQNALKGGATYQQMLDTVTKPLTEFIQKGVIDEYDKSISGEYGSGSRGSGSGSGLGSGSGKGSGSDSGKTQNVKNRVDLVLCNKKTIPKLNVNLFKKPPSFTILNKNFKVRDIKINTQDKPKAMMNAIKNGIIDIQRRTDPKIIQDEEAEYMPTEATDGDNLPKGSTQTTT